MHTRKNIPTIQSHHNVLKRERRCRCYCCCRHQTLRQDFDPNRKKKITQQQFLSVLGNMNLSLTEREQDAICRKYVPARECFHALLLLWLRRDLLCMRPYEKSFGSLWGNMQKNAAAFFQLCIASQKVQSLSMGA